MLARSQRDRLLIETDNDLDFFFTQIPLLINKENRRETPAKKLSIILNIDGKFDKELSSKPESLEEKAEIRSIKKTLRDKGFKMVPKKIANKFLYVRMTLSQQYLLVGCNDKNIIGNIREDLVELKALGFSPTREKVTT